MTYLFKSQPEDFIVQELLLTQPEGEGDVFWIQFEKRNLTTMDVLAHLLRTFPLERKDLGIAGLKDKIGITRQRLTIFRSKLEACGGESVFLSTLSEKVKIIETKRGKSVLRIGGNAGNKFKIIIRNIWMNVCHSERSEESLINRDSSFRFAPSQWQILTNISKIKKSGFPNAFWHQRFWKKMKNFWEARENIHAHRHCERSEANQSCSNHRFSLQSYPSGRFNEYVMTRREKGQITLEGDVMVDRYQAACHCEPKAKQSSPSQWQTFIPTWPMLWYDLLLAPEGTKARIREDQLLELATFWEREKEICKQLHLMGYRRPLWVRVPDLEVKFEETDAIFTFSLPTGSYATVLLNFILAGIDDKSLKENKLDIPRIDLKKLQN